MSCLKMTNPIENESKIERRKIGILTNLERDRLKSGEIKYYRQMKNVIKDKAKMAILSDIPLILEKTDLKFDLEWTGISWRYAPTRIFFNEVKGRLERERAAKGVKRKVSNGQVWQQVAKELGSYYEF